jgi:hypothetical protein
MSDTTFFETHPDPAAVRRREMRKQLEEQVAADERAQSAREHLAALKRERDPLLSRIERLKVNGDLTYIVKDPTGLAPCAGLVVGGKLGDLLPQAKADLAELDRQIVAAKADLAALDC